MLEDNTSQAHDSDSYVTDTSKSIFYFALNLLAPGDNCTDFQGTLYDFLSVKLGYSKYNLERFCFHKIF